MEAIILAGGKGTRLNSIVKNIPKPMADINGKPFLFYILSWLRKHGASSIIISTGYMHQAITGYFGNLFMGIRIRYTVETTPLGTGGAIMLAMEKAEGNDVAVVNGDTFFPIDIDMLFRIHVNSGSRFMMALKPMENFSRYGTVECRGDTVTKFNEKKFCAKGYINGGIYTINRSYMQSLGLKGAFSLEKDIFERKLPELDIRCMAFDDTFIDIGTPEDYLKAAGMMKQNPPPLRTNCFTACSNDR
jgi:D-glycero-alpha-D-manno-heptose 1-phosphate guanylyltransferase